jgi:hypothetical protein
VASGAGAKTATKLVLNTDATMTTSSATTSSFTVQSSSGAAKVGLMGTCVGLGWEVGWE